MTSGHNQAESELNKSPVMERTDMPRTIPWTETGNEPSAFFVPHPQNHACTWALVGPLLHHFCGEQEKRMVLSTQEEARGR